MATAQRPSFSSDTNTTSPGTLELEAGVALDDAQTFDSPVTLKWGATQQTELFLGASPYRRLDVLGEKQSGFGDLTVGVRSRFLEESDRRPSAAFQLVTKLPSSDEDKGLGSGAIDFFGAGLVTRNLGRSTFVGYYQLGVLGEAGSTGVDLQHALAFAAGHPVYGELSGFVELTGIFTPDLDEDVVQTMLGASYRLQSNLILDGAVLIGLTEDAVDLAFMAGTTLNLGSLR